MRELIDAHIAALPEVQYDNRARISQRAGHNRQATVNSRDAAAL